MVNLLIFLARGIDGGNHIVEFIEQYAFRADLVTDGIEINEYVFNSQWSFSLTLIANKDFVIVDTLHRCRSDSTALADVVDRIEPAIIAQLKVGLKVDYENVYI